MSAAKYTIRGLRSSHLASEDALSNLDSEWREIKTMVPDGGILDLSTDNKTNLKLECGNCGTILDNVQNGGNVTCPDCGEDFFFVSQLVVRQVVEVQGVSVFISQNNFLHFELPESLPDGSKVYYAWGDASPASNSNAARLFKRPILCPDEVSRIRYIIYLPDDQCTEIMQAELRKQAPPQPGLRTFCQICGTLLSGTSNTLTCPTCGCRYHSSAGGKLITKSCLVNCPCGAQLWIMGTSQVCHSCGRTLSFDRSCSSWIYTDPPQKQSQAEHRSPSPSTKNAPKKGRKGKPGDKDSCTSCGCLILVIVLIVILICR